MSGKLPFTITDKKKITDRGQLHWEMFCAKSCTQQGQPQCETRLLRTLLCWGLRIHKDAQPSGSLYHDLHQSQHIMSQFLTVNLCCLCRVVRHWNIAEGRCRWPIPGSVQGPIGATLSGGRCLCLQWGSLKLDDL